MKTTMTKKLFTTLAALGVLAAIGCGGAPEETASSSTGPAASAKAASSAPRWEKLNAEDPIEDLRTVTPGSPQEEPAAAMCRAPLVPCGYCEGYIFCTTWNICEKICGDKG